MQTTTYSLPGNHTASVGDTIVFGYVSKRGNGVAHTTRRGTVVPPNRYQANNKSLTITYIDENTGQPVFKSFNPTFMYSVAVIHRS